jgi:hypothetical protein
MAGLPLHGGESGGNLPSMGPRLHRVCSEENLRGAVTFLARRNRFVRAWTTSLIAPRFLRGYSKNVFPSPFYSAINALWARTHDSFGCVPFYIDSVPSKLNVACCIARFKFATIKRRELLFISFAPLL